MKEIIRIIEANVKGRTLFTKELVYELENDALQGVYSDLKVYAVDSFCLVSEDFAVWMNRKREDQNL